jgi:hypothetical protein
MNRSVKQHVEKIRFKTLLAFMHFSRFNCCRTLEMDLTKSNQEVAMLKLQNGRSCGVHFFQLASFTRISGSSEHQKILEQLKSDNQSKSDQV